MNELQNKMTMKKKLLFMMAMLTGVGTAIADNVTVENLTIPYGGQAALAVNYQFDVAEQYSGWQFSLVLPEGLTTVKDAKGNPSFTSGNCYDTSYTFSSSTDGETDDFVALSLQSNPIMGTAGVLISIPIVGAETLTVGSTFNATLKGIQFGNIDGVHTTFIDDVNFTITIGEPAETRVILDENSTIVPESAIGVDVRVKRTIKANEWSTICLPFAMTETQVKAAFGDDVQLADFTGTDEPEYDESDNVVGITANFTDVQAIEANHPYIIKVSTAVTEFTVDGVDIETDEDEACIEFDNGLTGRRRVVYSGFYGTYHAQTTLEEFTLFLNSNKFWYSAGLTKIKAFRAYFFFLDILAEVENGSSNVKMFINPDDDATGIVSPLGEMEEGAAIYNVAGQRVGKNYKGIVIENGKKIKK